MRERGGVLQLGKYPHRKVGSHDISSMLKRSATCDKRIANIANKSIAQPIACCTSLVNLSIQKFRAECIQRNIIDTYHQHSKHGKMTQMTGRQMVLTYLLQQYRWRLSECYLLPPSI